MIGHSAANAAEATVGDRDVSDQAHWAWSLLRQAEGPLLVPSPVLGEGGAAATAAAMTLATTAAAAPGGSVPLQPDYVSVIHRVLHPVAEIKQRPGLARAGWFKRQPFLN